MFFPDYKHVSLSSIFDPFVVSQDNKQYFSEIKIKMIWNIVDFLRKLCFLSVYDIEIHSPRLRGWVDGELQLGLLAVVHRQTLHKQGGEARAGATAEGVEDEEALQTGALVSQLTESVEDKVNDLLADGVVAAGVVVGGVLLACDELFRVEELTVGAGADLVCMTSTYDQVVALTCCQEELYLFTDLV